MAIFSVYGASNASDYSMAPLGYAKAALQKRYLNQLKSEVAKGDVTGAQSTLKKAIKAFASTIGSPNTLDNSTQNVLNNDFAALAKSLDKADAKTAKTNWNKLETHLNDAGVTLTKSAVLAVKAQAIANANTASTLSDALFGGSTTQSNNWGWVYGSTGAKNPLAGGSAGNYLNATA